MARTHRRALPSRYRLHSAGHAPTTGNAAGGTDGASVWTVSPGRLAGDGAPVLHRRAATAGGHVPIVVSRPVSLQLARYLRAVGPHRDRRRDLLPLGGDAS